jgi:DGQHR domain-containing protein
MAGATKKPVKKKPKLTLEQRKEKAAERAFLRKIRTIFQKTGFSRVSVEGKHFEFSGRSGEFDDIFVKENLIICAEYTLHSKSNIGDHVKNKAHLFNLIHNNPSGFVAFLLDKFPDVAESVSDKYHVDQLRLRIIYCSPDEINSEHAALTDNTRFMWRGTIEYFKSLSDTVRLSARHELFDFLKLKFGEVGEHGAIPDAGDQPFKGTLLPEVHSNFAPGYKVVSFYVSPAALLSRAYVLRKDGWKDVYGLYQRMIDRKKIEAIRRHLRLQKRVFVNNIIVTLPDDTRIDDKDGTPADATKITETTPVVVRLPQNSNSVGIVDGQHRVFSYYEDTQDDPQISKFRNLQNLLATGIMYPKNLPEADRRKFEAGLFLEINSTQNSPASGVIQAVGIITDPYLHDSIGKGVVSKLAQMAPLEGLLERHFFDQNVLKTASIVSFGLRRLVRLDGNESLIHVWTSSDKEAVKAKSNDEALQAYVAFCSSQLAMFLSAAKANLPTEAWKIASKDGAGILATVSVNGLIILFRKVVKAEGLSDFEGYKAKLKMLNKFNFQGYHSSHYNSMANDMMATIYGK